MADPQLADGVCENGLETALTRRHRSKPCKKDAVRVTGMPCGLPHSPDNEMNGDFNENEKKRSKERLLERNVPPYSVVFRQTGGLGAGCT